MVVLPGPVRTAGGAFGSRPGPTRPARQGPGDRLAAGLLGSGAAVGGVQGVQYVGADVELLVPVHGHGPAGVHVADDQHRAIDLGLVGGAFKVQDDVVVVRLGMPVGGVPDFLVD